MSSVLLKLCCRVSGKWLCFPKSCNMAHAQCLGPWFSPFLPKTRRAEMSESVGTGRKTWQSLFCVLRADIRPVSIYLKEQVHGQYFRWTLLHQGVFSAYCLCSQEVTQQAEMSAGIRTQICLKLQPGLLAQHRGQSVPDGSSLQGSHLPCHAVEVADGPSLEAVACGQDYGFL